MNKTKPFNKVQSKKNINSTRRHVPKNKNNDSSQNKWWVPIIVALIGLLGVIYATNDGKFFSPPMPTSTLTPTVMPTATPTLTPTLTATITLTSAIPTPTISISSDVRDINGNPIAMNSAPFQVKVSGTVSNANGYYVYLIVADKNHHYVEPGLGLNVSNEFYNVGQLGTIGIGFGQQYTVYAVVTDKPYADFAWFEGESFIAKSKELKIIREPMSTPTP